MLSEFIEQRSTERFISLHPPKNEWPLIIRRVDEEDAPARPRNRDVLRRCANRIEFLDSECQSTSAPMRDKRNEKRCHDARLVEIARQLIEKQLLKAVIPYLP